MIKKIRVEHLEAGMFISDFNTPWLSHPFIPTRIAIRSGKDIDRMLRCGMTEVYIDTSRGKDSPKAIPVEETDRELEERLHQDISADEEEPEPFQRPRVPFEAEFRRARQIYAEARTSIRTQFDAVQQGERVDGEVAHATATDVIRSLFRNRDALLCASRIRKFDEYTFRHSINVTVLALNLAVHLGILHDELKRLGIGALLHDLGKVRVPDGLIQKQGPLDQREYEVVKSHAPHGAKLILEARSVPLDCASVALSHHERFDGTGYPRRLSGPGVGKFGLITAIADVYDAMTSDRPYQRGMSPTRALKRLYDWAGSHFHPIYVRRFIQCVGIFPIGSVVLLDSGEMGVVTCQNHGELLRPWVRLARAPDGSPLPAPIDVDLRGADPSGARLFARTIETVLDPGSAGLDVERLLAPLSSPQELPELGAAQG